MSDVELMSIILKCFAAFGLSMLLFALLPKTRARNFLIFLFCSYMFVTFAKSLAQRELGDREAAANKAERERIEMELKVEELVDKLDEVANKTKMAKLESQFVDSLFTVGYEARNEISEYDNDIADSVNSDDVSIDSTSYNTDDDYELDEEVEDIRINEYHVFTDSIGIGTTWNNVTAIEDYELWYTGMSVLNGEEWSIKKLNPTPGSADLYEVLGQSLFPSNRIDTLPFVKIKGYKDSDHDGLSDGDEILWGTNPYAVDSDCDGLWDKYEVDNKLDPINNDSDEDGVLDGDEVIAGSNPGWPDQEPEPAPIPGCFFTIIGEWEIQEEAYDPSTNQRTRVMRNMPRLLTENSAVVDDPAGIGYYHSYREPFVYCKTGKTFIPTRTGYYAFRIDADDVGTLSIGPVVARSVWPDEGLEVRGLFVEGEEYPISVRLVNNGGPVEIICRKFGEFTPIKLASLQTSVSASATVYEKAYYDEGYRKSVDHRASPITYRIMANGGPFGSRLDFEYVKGEKVYRQTGDDIPRGSILMEPQAEYKKVCVLGGKSSSSSHEDVILRTILTENRTGVVTTNEHKITSIGLNIEAESNITTKHRHVFGPLENVTLSPTLINDKISWKLNGMTVGSTNGVWSKRALSIPGSENCELRYDGCGLKFKLRTIEPKRRHVESVERNRIGDWESIPSSMFTPPPIELWCCMQFEQSLLPFYVSFKNLRVREDTCPAVGCNGCFANMEGTYHNPGPLVVSMMTVNDRNELSKPDFAGKHGVVTTDGVRWLWGEYRWEIPVKWQTIEDDPADDDSWHELAHKDTQIFNLTNGILSVSKFGFTARRTRININDVQDNSEVDNEEDDE